MKKIINISKLLLAIAFISFTQIALAQSNTYKTGIGIRGGFTSGLSIKHFVKSNAAIEGIVGTRYRGISLTGLYEWHSPKALAVPRLSWVYGLGLRAGFYNGKYYREYGKDYYYGDRDYSVISLVGILGLEYHFKEVPISLGADILPYFDLNSRGDNFLDGSLAIRFTF
jgi:hypothetical protein